MPYPKNLILGIFKPSKPSPLNLFAKIEIRHLSYFMMWNFMEQKRNNWWFRDLAFQGNGKRSEAKLIGHSCQGGCPTHFSSQRRYRLSVVVWWYFLVRQGLIQAFLACLMGINDLLLLLKNINLEQRQQRWEPLPT